jgi:diguanylate cyclase
MLSQQQPVNQTVSRIRCPILAVDDDPAMLRSVSELLRLHGLDVTTARDGQEALEALKTSNVEVLLLDLHMHGVDGFELMARVADEGIDVAMIVVSGDTSIDAAIESLRRGACDYLRKPYAPESLVRTVENIAHRRRLEKENRTMREQLEKSEQLYRFMVHSSPDLVYMLDDQGRFTFLNDRVEAMLGFNRESLIGQHYSTVVAAEDRALARYRFNERHTGDRAAANLELRLRRKAPGREPATKTIPVELTAMGVYRTQNGEIQFIGSYGVARDLTERKQSEEIIKHQANHDLLTGLPNRNLFMDRLSQALNQAKRGNNVVAVVFLDLDRFKLVNDTLGHATGDALLRAVAQRLVGSLRTEDTIARIGGDEFLLLLPHIHSGADAERVAEKLVYELKPPFLIVDQEFRVSASMGIALYPYDGDSVDLLIRNADVAMYDAKHRRNGSYCSYTRGMDAAPSRHFTFEREIRLALELSQFEVYYQPLVHSPTGAVLGLEALIRWNHPSYGQLAPAEFIPVAEQSGLISEIGRVVLRRVCTDLRHWLDTKLPFIRLSVNLSSQHVDTKDFVEDVLGSLREHNLTGDHLEVEITENILLCEIETVIEKLRMLNDFGVTVAIDDFGTGYSSLSYLRKLPIHSLKIDRSFVNDIEKGSADSCIVPAIISMAKTLGLNIIAEGVETAGQRDYLEALGCGLMQGFLFSPAVPANEAAGFLRKTPFARPFGSH